MLVVTRYGEALKHRFISEIAEVKELPEAPTSEIGWMAMANRVARREKPVIKPFDFSPSVSWMPYPYNLRRSADDPA